MRQHIYQPCIPTRGTEVPAGDDWFHEVKHDGYRLIVYRQDRRVRLFTRQGYDWSDRYPLVVEAALRIKKPHSRSMAKPWFLGLTAFLTSAHCTAGAATQRFGSTPSTF
jgi:hypothetical protein